MKCVKYLIDLLIYVVHQTHYNFTLNAYSLCFRFASRLCLNFDVQGTRIILYVFVKILYDFYYNISKALFLMIFFQVAHHFFVNVLYVSKC